MSDTDTDESNEVPWWTKMGYHPFQKGTNGFPRPDEVIAYYQQHSPVSLQDIASALGVKEQTLTDSDWTALSMDNRRDLVHYLRIPPFLLGITMIAENAEAWRASGIKDHLEYERMLYPPLPE